MDSTESEQERGITMKSSSASLFYNPEMNLGRGLVAADAAAHPKSYLINLIDSPGHVDFASDVSTAVRLCDGAVIVVDVVEGVCPQTRAVLRQAWNERLALVLLLNKIDRLFLELRLSPLEVYDRLLRVLEQVNSVLAEMFTADVLQGNYEQPGAKKEATTSEDQGKTSGSGGTFTWSTGLEQTDDSHVYFSPDRANVIFASAIDSWGFRISDFLDFWSTRLKIPKKGLSKVLWGDYYLIPATGDTPPKVKGHARAKGKKPVFVQLIIDQLFSVYKTLILDENLEKAQQIADKLGIHLEPRLLRSTDGRMVLRSVLSTWLPLGPSIFQTVVDMCPSPVKAVSRSRAMYMFFGESASSLVDAPALPSTLPDESPVGAPGDDDLAISLAIDALQQCSAEAEAPVLIFVSKVFWTDKQKSLHSSQPPAPWPSHSNSASGPTAVPKSPSIGEGGRSRAFALFNRPLVMPENPFVTTEFVALSRIYSGRVYIGQRLFVLGPKFDGSKVPEYLLDADASDFPLGPLHLSDADDLSSHETRSTFGTSPSSSASSVLSRSFSGGSMDSNTRQVLRHVYVAEICDVVQFAGGQNNVTRLSDPNCPVQYLPAGNVVGLIGPSLIASLPKSGLLVSRLRLVASPEETTADADVDLLDGVRRPGRRVLPLAGLAVWHGAPVVSLAVEPASATNPDDLTKLEQGLRLLERSDPCAEVTISSKGEYLLHAAGEVHMQKCLEDLTKYFAPDLEIHTSQFVVPFRETVTRGCPPDVYVPFDSYAYAQMQLELELKRLNLIYDPEHENCVRRMTAEERSQAAAVAATTAASAGVGLSDQRQQSEADSMRQQQLLLHRKQDEPQGDWVKWMPLGMLQLPHCKSKTRLFIRVTAHPIPPRLLSWLETRATIYVPQLLRSLRHKSWRNTTCIKKFEAEFAAVLDSLSSAQEGDTADTNAPAEVDYVDWASLKNQLVCFGPEQVGPNILFSRLRSRLFRLNTAWGKPVPVWVDDTSTCPGEDAVTTTASHIPFLSYGKTILRGFQMATEQGPLCAEPMRGVAFILEDIYAEDRHKLPTPTVLQGPAVSATGLEAAAPSTKEAAKEDDQKAETSDTKEVETPAMKEAQAEEEENANDPILMALRAKQAAAQMRQKSRRLASLSWLDLDDDDEFDEEDWDFDEDFDDVYGDGDGGKSGSSESDDSDSNAEEDVQTAAPEKKIHLPDLFYWKRRTDGDWLSDVTPGLLTPTMARACIAAFQACPGQRLVLSMYDVELQSRSDVLGRMYSVLRKHFGRVIGEDLREGEECFVIRARLPVIESFGLTSDLRKRTSGVVTLPQLRPGGWEVLDIDPLQRDASGRVAVGEAHFKIFQYQQDVLRRLRSKPGNKRTTVGGAAAADEGASSESEQDEELLLDEVNAQLTRLRNYIRSVRQRKGLCLNEQLVVSADKQRTLKKNK